MSIKLSDIVRLAVRDPDLRALMTANQELAAMGEDQIVETLMLGASDAAKDDRELAVTFTAVKRIANQIYDMGVAHGRTNPT